MKREKDKTINDRGKKSRETYKGGCRRPPIAGSWPGSSPPPRADTWCSLFGSAAG